MPYANNKGTDQPAHPLSLISTIVVCCLDWIICILAKSKMSSLYLVYVAKQTGLSLTWLQPRRQGILWRGSYDVSLSNHQSANLHADQIVTCRSWRDSDFCCILMSQVDRVARVEGGGGGRGRGWLFPFHLLPFCLLPFCLLPFRLLSNFTSFLFHLTWFFCHTLPSAGFDGIMVKHANMQYLIW